MEWNWTIYFLSVSEGITHVGYVVGTLTLIGAALVWMVNDLERNDPFSGVPKRLAIAAGILLSVAALIPTPKAIIRAYAMTEGAKILNADNAEAARVRKAELELDALIEALGER